VKKYESPIFARANGSSFGESVEGCLLLKVSVIIPTYQSVQFVRDALESVLAQTYQDYEIIVVDGGSTDGTLKVLEEYSACAKVITQKGHGISNARNAGVLASKGEYIAFLDSDDVWLSDKLECQVRFFESKPKTVGLICSDVSLFGDDYSSLNASAFCMRRPYRGRVLEHLLIENFVSASTVMIRKSCFETVGYFDESLSISEDWDMWIRTASFFELDYQDMILAKFRIRMGSLTKNKEQLLQSQIALKRKIAQKMPRLLRNLDLRRVRCLYYLPHLRLGVLYLLRYDSMSAKRELREYVRLCPDNIAAYFFLLLTLIPLNKSLRVREASHKAWAKQLYELVGRSLKGSGIVL